MIPTSELSKYVGPILAAKFNQPNIAGAKLFIGSDNLLHIAVVGTDGSRPEGHISTASTPYNQIADPVTAHSSTGQQPNQNPPRQSTQSHMVSSTSNGEEMTRALGALIAQ